MKFCMHCLSVVERIFWQLGGALVAIVIAIAERWLLKQNGLYGPSTGCCGEAAIRGTTVVNIRLVICNSLPSFLPFVFRK